MQSTTNCICNETERRRRWRRTGEEMTNRVKRGEEIKREREKRGEGEK